MIFHSYVYQRVPSNVVATARPRPKGGLREAANGLAIHRHQLEPWLNVVPAGVVPGTYLAWPRAANENDFPSSSVDFDDFDDFDDLMILMILMVHLAPKCVIPERTARRGFCSCVVWSFLLSGYPCFLSNPRSTRVTCPMTSRTVPVPQMVYSPASLPQSQARFWTPEQGSKPAVCHPFELFAASPQLLIGL